MDPARHTTHKYLAMILASLSAQNVHSIPEETFRSPARVSKLLDRLLVEWKKAEDTGKLQYAFDLLKIYADLGVSVGTNQHDGLISKIRQLQPGYLGLSNPYYSEFKPTPGSHTPSLATTEQVMLAKDSARIFLEA